MELVLNYSPESHQSGIATYFRGYLSKFLKDWAAENPKPDGGTYNIYRDGLKVYTTLDSRMQKHAEKAVAGHMKSLQHAFDRQNRNNKNAPFRGVTREEINQIIDRDIKNSHRYKTMKLQGKSEKEIAAAFDKKQKMRVFAWNDQRAVEDRKSVV